MGKKKGKKEKKLNKKIAAQLMLNSIISNLSFYIQCLTQLGFTQIPKAQSVQL